MSQILLTDDDDHYMDMAAISSFFETEKLEKGDLRLNGGRSTDPYKIQLCVDLYNKNYV